ncbi:hypothetical protein [Arenibaculum pallidiluteum]|uniref:hypothetical protein n=1 Tax=Arenibaculum pallidiluteum TaxID=2812559 RepID=UPI001A962EDB|nr:hypothetical protein [Arenibaculum pallidiluteum]
MDQGRQQLVTAGQRAIRRCREAIARSEEKLRAARLLLEHAAGRPAGDAAEPSEAEPPTPAEGTENPARR